jgi:hypothetical protein
VIGDEPGNTDEDQDLSEEALSQGQGRAGLPLLPEGKVLMTLGKPGIAGAGPDMFNAPTDVFVASNGDVFVSDGHGGNTNARSLGVVPAGHAFHELV